MESCFLVFCHDFSKAQRIYRHQSGTLDGSVRHVRQKLFVLIALWYSAFSGSHSHQQRRLRDAVWRLATIILVWSLKWIHISASASVALPMDPQKKCMVKSSVQYMAMIPEVLDGPFVVAGRWGGWVVERNIDKSPIPLYFNDILDIWLTLCNIMQG